MSSIDELFQKSGIPSKRKLAPARDPTEIYKAVRTSNGGGSRHAPAQANDNNNDDDEIEAGPALPPNGDGDDDDGGDYGPAPPPDDDDGDDDEGRFFGGGITKTEASILDYVESGADGTVSSKTTTAADLDPSSYDAAWLRKTALNFEKRINRNAELRARYEADPTKFIASEADLDADIKALSILGEHPELYPEVARLGTAASLVGLLAHDNTDIAISAIEILGELTDEDVDGATDAQWTALVDALLDADLVGLLVSNLQRLKERAADDPDGVDRAGVYHALAIVENLCSLRATRAADALGQHTALLKWLLQRVQSKDKDADNGERISQNTQYAAEILAILAQASAANARRLVRLDAIDVLLQLVAAYRRRDPEKGSDEEEYMENLFEALTYLVEATEEEDTSDSSEATALPLGKAKFVEAEGVELCLLLLKDGKKSRAPALRLLDHATSGRLAGDVCRKVVDAGGLKTLFTLFMRGEENSKNKKKHHQKGDKRLHAGATAEALLNIMASMLRLLPADADERIRLLAKFVEKDYDKVGQLAALRAEYAARVAAVDTHMAAAGRGPQHVTERMMDEDEREAIATERLSRQLDAGLSVLQTIDIVLAWLVAEDGGARRTIHALLQPACDAKFGLLRTSLADRRAELDLTLAEGAAMHEMLTALIEFVDSL